MSPLWHSAQMYPPLALPFQTPSDSGNLRASCDGLGAVDLAGDGELAEVGQLAQVTAVAGLIVDNGVALDDTFRQAAGAGRAGLGGRECTSSLGMSMASW